MSSFFYAWVPLTALILDSVFGDPRSAWHPVVLIGRLISFLEEKLYPLSHDSPAVRLTAGGLLVLAVLSVTGAVSGILLEAAASGGPWAYGAVSAVILYFTITPRSLARDGLEIQKLLQQGDLAGARKRLSWIVGRDTDRLDESGVSRAAVETIAENTVDGVISPLFWFLLLGPVGAACYRAANTMDSMVGYRNVRYLYFGRCAARLDDVVNWIPARITFCLLTAAAFLLREDWRNACRIGKRDASLHPSPNGGYAEAPAAGALHIRLGGYNQYEGKTEFRAYMGDPDRPVEAGHIGRTLALMYTATLLFIAAETLILLIR